MSRPYPVDDTWVLRLLAPNGRVADMRLTMQSDVDLPMDTLRQHIADAATALAALLLRGEGHTPDEFLKATGTPLPPLP